MRDLKEKVILQCILPLAERVMHTKAMKWYHRIYEMNRWTPEQVREWQEEQLRAFVKHAYEHTVYYREVFDSLGLKPEDIQHVEDLKKLPVLTKDTIRSRYEDLIPDNISRFRYRKKKTGGSTGEPMNFNCDEDVWGYVTAAKMVAWRTTGYRYGDPFVALGSASLFKKKASLPRRIYDHIRNEIPMNCINQTDEISAKYVEVIRKRKVHYIYGYAAAIYVFAQYVKRTQTDLSQIRAVFTTSENLTQHYRHTIEEAFGCKVMDCFGSHDAGMSAYEYARNSYRVGYNAITEVVDEIAPNTGTLLTTNILNYSMPLIRYNFGDIAELATDVDIEEYNGQVIRHIEGRTSDVIVLENGHHLTATGFSMIMQCFPVIAFDFRKSGNNEVTMRIQKKNEFCVADENTIRETILNYIGDDCKFIIEYVEDFEARKNGKRSFFFVE